MLWQKIKYFVFNEETFCGNYCSHDELILAQRAKEQTTPKTLNINIKKLSSTEHLSAVTGQTILRLYLTFCYHHYTKSADFTVVSDTKTKLTLKIAHSVTLIQLLQQEAVRPIKTHELYNKPYIYLFPNDFLQKSAASDFVILKASPM